MKRTRQLPTYLLCAFLISSICLTSFQVLGYPNAKAVNTQSRGRIVYPSTPAATPTPTPTPTGSPDPTPISHSGLHVDGNKLKDENGNVIILRGVNLDSGQFGDANSEIQFVYMKNMGCNFVCLDLSPYNMVWNRGGGNSYPQYSDWTTLDNMITWAGNQGLYVLLRGFHLTAASTSATFVGGNPPYGEFSDISWLMNNACTWDQYINWWRNIAIRYANNYNVMFGMMDEPRFCDLATYASKHEATIDAIRAVAGNENRICAIQAVGTGNWETMSFHFMVTNPINRPNLMFSYDPYGFGSSNTQESIRSGMTGTGGYHVYAKELIAMGYPIILAETGGNENGQDEFSRVYCNNEMIVCDTDGFSGYSFWRWITSTWESAWHLLADYNGNLSTYGTWIKDYYLSH